MKIIFFLSFFITIHVANAQTGQHDFKISSDYAVDTNSLWTPQTLTKVRYKPIGPNENLNYGYNRQTAIWCRFKIKNEHNTQTLTTWLCFNNNNIDSLTLYDNGMVQTIGDRTSNLSPFMGVLAFELKLNPGEERSLLVRIKKETSFLDFSYSVENTDTLTKQSLRKIAVVSFFIGMVILLLIINASLLIITKKKLYAYYIFYSILTTIYVLIATNFAKHIFFPSFIYFSECKVYLGSLWFISLSYFLCCFLDLKKNQKAKYQVITAVNKVNVLIMLITLTILLLDKGWDLKYFFILGYVNFLVCIITLFWSSISHLKIKKTAAIYVLFAFLPQLIWGIGIILKSFQLIPDDLSDNWLVLMSLYEVFLFGYVLTRSYFDIFSKNNELMQQIIVEKERSLQDINQVQIRERRSIANIIHDNVGSKIAYITHLLQMKNAKLALQATNELATEIRDISHKILPKALDSGALVSSLKSQITNMNFGLQETKIELFSYDFPERIDEIWLYDLYLISLEIISNSLKHGKPKVITLELYQHSNEYIFQFTDDGIGFDPEQMVKGFGLDNIEKRVHYYKGMFDMNSALGQGTLIQITLQKSAGIKNR